MDNQFTYCPKCGVRNFADDDFCGVCKSKLLSTPNQKPEIKPTTQPINSTVIFSIIGCVLFIYFVFIKEGETSEISSQKAYNESILENSPAQQLAVINDHSRSPKPSIVDLFSDLLTSLNEIYSNRSKQDIANAIVAAHNIIIQKGQTESLLRFTIEFHSFSKELDGKTAFSIEESLVLFIRMVYHV